MNDDEIIKDILKDLEEMSVEDLVEALENADDWGLGELLGDPLQYHTSLRREALGKMMNEHKLSCPECKTRQVQLVGYINIHPAQWKCRHCKYEFSWEV